MDYAWKIIKLKYRDEVNDDGVTLPNSVVRVDWKKIATDTDGTSATYTGITNLSAKAVAENDFVALGNLDKDTVVGWLTSSISDTDMKAINKILANKVEKNRNSTNELAPVWG